MEIVNSKIAARGRGYFVQSEDKEIGVFFVTTDFLSESKNNNDLKKIKRFGEKVLLYLWNDVVKTDPESLFVTNYEEKGKIIQINSLDELLDRFEALADSNTLSIFADDMFPTKE